MNEVIKKRSLHRAKIIEGQMRGIQKMIEDEEYCVNIITQSLAVQKSIGSLNKLVLENHLRTHVKDMFASGDVDKAVQEMISIYELSEVRSKS